MVVECAGPACVLVKVKLHKDSHYKVRPHLFTVLSSAPSAVRITVPDRERYRAAIAQGGGRHRGSVLFQEMELQPEEALAAAAAGGSEQGSKAQLAGLWKRLEEEGRPTRSCLLHADAVLPAEQQPPPQSQPPPPTPPLPHASPQQHAAASAAAGSQPRGSASGAGKEARGSALAQEPSVELLQREREEINNAMFRILEVEGQNAQLSKANREWIPQRDVRGSGAWGAARSRSPPIVAPVFSYKRPPAHSTPHPTPHTPATAQGE